MPKFNLSHAKKYEAAYPSRLAEMEQYFSEKGIRKEDVIADWRQSSTAENDGDATYAAGLSEQTILDDWYLDDVEFGRWQEEVSKRPPLYSVIMRKFKSHPDGKDETAVTGLTWNEAVETTEDFTRHQRGLLLEHVEWCTEIVSEPNLITHPHKA